MRLRIGLLSAVVLAGCAGVWAQTVEAPAGVATPPTQTNRNPNMDLLAESGAVNWHDGIATLTAAGPYPLERVADALSECLGIALSTERPLQIAFADDLLDVTAPNWLEKHPNGPHAFVSKPAKVSVDFRLDAAGNPADVMGMLKEVAEQVNEQQPYGFEVRTLQRKTGMGYVMVPTSTHDAAGQLIAPQPFLDTPITIKRQTAAIADFGGMVAEQVTQATGFHFECCLSGDGGGHILSSAWSIGRIEYEAVQKPAREVIADLMEAEGQPPRIMSGCEAASTWPCMINVQRTGALPGQTVGHTCKILGYR